MYSSRLPSIESGSLRDARRVPEGRSDSSPALKCRVWTPIFFVSPVGTTDAWMVLVQPSLRDSNDFDERAPGAKAPGYYQVPLPGHNSCRDSGSW